MAILPYIEQQELYNKFKLDEPWDSPHNKALIKEMPHVYRLPEPARRPSRARRPTRASSARRRSSTSRQGDGDARSHRRDVEHDHGRRGQGRRALDQARRPAVRPGGRTVPLYGAGSPHPGGFNALFADGSVRFIKNTIDPQVFKALITTHGGEVIAPDRF